MSIKTGVCTGCGREKRLTKNGLIYMHGACEGGGKPDRQSRDDKEFVALVKSQTPETPDVATLWDAVKLLWPHLHGEYGFLVKGMVLVEYLDQDTGRPGFMWVTSPYLPPWQQKGMFTQALEDLTLESLEENIYNTIALAQQEANSDDDDDDTEDEQ